MAASATFALKAGVWFRRGRLFIVSPDSLAQRARCQAETPLIVSFRFLRPALLTAASATFALKAGVWFRRGRLCMVAPDSQATARPPSGRNFTYLPVQISETSSRTQGKALRQSRQDSNKRNPPRHFKMSVTWPLAVRA
ncbi:hypothetical protein, partial [Bradyrhizobium sp.]|uniref:hypothetical protein n=1 Tax=Bradyrhizobium sp. TaxID=376 RepID=UPI003C79491B